MSSIHYKFRAELDYKTLQFDGLHIRGEQLVREICTKENLKLELFELQLQNAHTKKMYSDDELIPRNSSIIVQRFPRKDAAKVSKVQAGVNSGMVNQTDAAATTLDSGVHIASAEFENMDEAERLNHIRDQSTRAYDPSNFRRRPQGIMTGPPPPTYTCNRCYQPGHWYKNCPMLNTKRTTGIPSQELMETTADDPAAMLHPSGKYVVPIMHWKARQDTLAKKAEDGSSSPAQIDRKVPPELLCPLCQTLFKEAIVTSCCGNSYCAECIEQRIIDPENRKCPGADCSRDVSITSIIPNKTLRDAAAAWLNASAPGQPTTLQNTQEPEQIRIRIGLKAPATSNAGLPHHLVSSGISPGSVLVPQQAPVVPIAIAPAVPSSTIPQPIIPNANPAVPGLPSAPATVPVANLVQDVSLPPPHIHHELPPGIPGVPGIPQFSQPPLAIPGLPSTVLSHPSTVPISYGMPIYTPGFPPAASSAPRSSVLSGFDEWNTFLQNKDRNDKRRDKDRTRRKDRHDSRSHRRRFPKHYRDSSSSSSSSTSTYSGEEERLRRKRREKESMKKRRSVEKERQRRSDDRRDRERERERDRDHRDHRSHRDVRSSGRSKDTKVSTSSSSHRRERDEERHRERKKNDERKKDREEKAEDVDKERANKDVESKDEDEIDGILAEYGNVQMLESDGDAQVAEGERLEECDDKSTPHEKKSQSPKSKPFQEEEDEPAADEEPLDDDEILPVREKSLEPVNHAMETSEAEVAETKDEITPNEEEEEEQEMDVKKEDDEANEVHGKEKESQSSTLNTADEDDEGGKRSKKHKKSKKSKKHHRKDVDDDDEDEEKRRKKHKKHKKEKKAKKDKKEVDSDHEEERKQRKKERDEDKKNEDGDEDSDRKDRKKEKKDRTNEDYSTKDRDEKKKESAKKHDDDEDRKEKNKEKERRYEAEQDNKKERKRDRATEEYDSDKLQAPKIKVKREEKSKDDKKEHDREKDRKKEDYEKEKDRKKEKDKDERDKKREKEKEKVREKERDTQIEKDRETDRQKEKDRKEKGKDEAKQLEKPRRSVHERLQKAESVKTSSSSSSSSSKTVPSLGRKPVSFTVASSKAASNLRVRQYSSSSSTKEQEDEDRSKKDRRNKDETDVESIGDKEKNKKSRHSSSSGQTATMHKSTKIKFDL